MAQQAKQAAQRLGGMFPKGSGKGTGSAVGALVVLGALGYGVNASLFNGTLATIICFILLIMPFSSLSSRRWSQSYQVHSSFWCAKYNL
jgi:hypothetical protein